MKVLLTKRHFSTVVAKTLPLTKEYIKREDKYGCHNYHPLPVVIKEGRGIFVKDVDNRRYIDFLSAYSAVNQGHCHPKILKAFVDQARKLTLTSRAFYNDQLGHFEEYMAKTFKFDRMLPMNSGVEACESAVKFARRWAYVKKGVPDKKAKIIMAKNNFWGRSIAACASSDDPVRYNAFGPYGSLGFELIPFNDVQALEAKLKSDPNIAAFMVEPIQGEAGVVVPQAGYLRRVKQLCQQYNVLLILDEVQTGLGRTGKLMCYEWDGIRPDMVTLGKALSGGFMPVSCLLANDEVMLNIHPGEHGSTFGGNPLASVTAIAAVQTIIEEGMVENSQKMGELFRSELHGIKSDLILDIRGKGLMNAIEVVPDSKVSAGDLCLKMMEKGLLAKPTHDTTIRFAPPLIIKEDQILKAVRIIKASFAAFNAPKGTTKRTVDEREDYFETNKAGTNTNKANAGNAADKKKKVSDGYSPSSYESEEAGKRNRTKSPKQTQTASDATKKQKTATKEGTANQTSKRGRSPTDTKKEGASTKTKKESSSATSKKEGSPARAKSHDSKTQKATPAKNTKKEPASTTRSKSQDTKSNTKTKASPANKGKANTGKAQKESAATSKSTKKDATTEKTKKPTKMSATEKSEALSRAGHVGGSKSPGTGKSRKSGKKTIEVDKEAQEALREIGQKGGESKNNAESSSSSSSSSDENKDKEDHASTKHDVTPDPHSNEPHKAEEGHSGEHGDKQDNDPNKA